MNKFLIYSFISILILLGAYLFTPNIDPVQLTADGIYIEAPLKLIVTCAAVFLIALAVILCLIFKILTWPSRIACFLDKRASSKNLEKILQILYLLDTNSKIRLRFTYSKKVFEGIDHPGVHTTNLRVANMLGNEELKAASETALAKQGIKNDEIPQKKDPKKI